MRRSPRVVGAPFTKRARFDDEPAAADAGVDDDGVDDDGVDDDEDDVLVAGAVVPAPPLGFVEAVAGAAAASDFLLPPGVPPPGLLADGALLDGALLDAVDGVIAFDGWPPDP